MQLLKVSEAAKRLRVSPQAVRDLCDQKKLMAIRVSGKPRGHRQIVAESLDKYLLSLVESESPRQRFVPQVVEWDDSERELAELIKLSKRRKKA